MYVVQIMAALPVLEKDPAVTCISVHNCMKADFVADDIIRAVCCCRLPCGDAMLATNPILQKFCCP